MAAIGTGSLVFNDDVTANRSSRKNSELYWAVLSVEIQTNAVAVASHATASQMNIDSFLLDQTKKCVGTVTWQKEIKIFPNQKPWINREVHLLRKARDAAVRSGDWEATAQPGAIWGGGFARQTIQRNRIEEVFKSTDPWHMWQGIQTIVCFKPSSTQ